jgi:hypothetical protein
MSDTPNDRECWHGHDWWTLPGSAHDQCSICGAIRATPDELHLVMINRRNH